MKETNFNIKNIKCFLFKDPYNEGRSKELFSAVEKSFEITTKINEADAVIVIGGDGTLLKVARDPILNKLPILALNGGTVGKNLIDINPEELPEVASKINLGECKLLEFPVIEAKIKDTTGNTHTHYAFNDIFIDRYLAHSVKYIAQVNTIDEETVEITDSPISGDGILVSTPVGSTGYARVISDIILPLHDKSMLICPKASMVLENKKKLHGFAIAHDQSLDVKFLDIDFRPARIAVDGIYLQDAKGNFIFAESANFKMCNDENTIKLISPSKNNFVRKQMDFIAR